MLHEAVIFEIYKQALNARETPIMRCPSRQSSISGVLDESRCTSNHSQYSGVESSSPIQTPIPFAFSNDFVQDKTAFLPVTSLFPTQSSAAMAVYFNAAAVAAVQQSHLLLTHPLATTATTPTATTPPPPPPPELIQQQQQRHSPKIAFDDTKSQKSSENEAINDADSTESISNFSTHHLKTESNQSNAATEQAPPPTASDDSKKCNFEYSEEFKETSNESINSPLDLSLSKDRKREIPFENTRLPDRKILRMNAVKSSKFDLWAPTISKYLASVNIENLPHPPIQNINNNSQNNSPTSTPTIDQNAQEKLNTKNKESVFGALSTADPSATVASSTTDGLNTVYNPNIRHNAWQSHWLNKGVDVVKDILKCVWCKRSFPSLDSLTKHLKATPHCGIGSSCAANIEEIAQQSSVVVSSTQSSGNSSSNSSITTISNLFSKYQNSSVAEKKSDLNLQQIKESLPLPRKLVRGQDIWIGKGAEQTRQILKCMWCGQSFRSLAEMTSHMQETQHYTNIVSQEQIISWKSNDEKKNSSTSSNANADASVPTPKLQSAARAEGNGNVKNMLTCEVCSQTFITLKELNSHKAQNNHQHHNHQHNMVDINQNFKKRCRQTREKRKRSLPVRKLLEMERAEYNGKSNELNHAPTLASPLTLSLSLPPPSSSPSPSLPLPPMDLTSARKITCEKCENKIEAAHFVEHIRQCLGDAIFNLPSSRRECSKSQNPRANENVATDLKDQPNCDRKLPNVKCQNSSINSSSSVLSAIEELIEKSFEQTAPKKHNNINNNFIPYKSSILKRLRLDNSNGYHQQFQPVVDSETLNFLQTSKTPSKRNRSESESSSISNDRCGSSHLETLKKTPKYEYAIIGDNDKSTKLSLDSNSNSNKGQQIDFHNESMPKMSANKDQDRASFVKSTQKNQTSLDLTDNGTPSVVNSFIRVRSPSDLTKDTAVTHSLPAKSSKNKKSIVPENCLNALTSMFDNLNNKQLNNNNNNINNDSKKCITFNNNTKFSAKASPLVALQKLCEVNEVLSANPLTSKTEFIYNNNNNNEHIVGENEVAFNWPYGDFDITPEGMMKKSIYQEASAFLKSATVGAPLKQVDPELYLIKDDTDSQSSTSIKSQLQAPPPNSPLCMVLQKTAERSTVKKNTSNFNASTTSSNATSQQHDNAVQSKFLKYTELAKQLSSKNC